ncbi:MAG: DNA topoisomerase I, partial [Muribaculaceae bacterium]|nr:DNA topoisomerase I [Muribaculaceae bacterium]
GHITYMRTDSVNLSSLAINTISDEIKNEMGDKYLKVRHYHTSSKGAQEAHEAIRPTYISNKTIDGTPQEKRLYNLIWKRTIASQMSDAQLEKTVVEIEISNRPEHFTATGEVIKFDGFLKVYIEGHDDEGDNESSQDILPTTHKGDVLNMIDIKADSRYTMQPPRYSEASLVKKMEELGIGRPSTYAPTISTIQQRLYVVKSEKDGKPREFVTLELKNGKIKRSKRTETIGSEKGRLMPTDIGMVVNDFLTKYFPDILDLNFTANVEEKFDLIAEGKLPWNSEMREFYDPFHKAVEEASNMRLEHKVGERILGTDPATGRQVSVKIGRFGPVVQLGEADNDVKPQFASLLKGQSVSTLTLEDAIKLFEFPRTIGEFEGKDITVAIGRFGPYIKHDSKFVSIPKSISPAEITAEEAIELIESKRKEDKEKVVKTFDEDPDLKIQNGRYGIYISYKKSNYKIPKSVADPANLSLEECMKIIEAATDRPKKTTTRRASARSKK